MTVIEIVTSICEKGVYAGYAKLDKNYITENYPKLEYCVQYRETDFEFICRILNHAGIYFFFKHQNNATILTLIDHSFSHQPYPNYKEIEFSGDGARESYGDERITAFVVAGEIQASGYELNDYDFESALNSSNGSLRTKETFKSPYEMPAFQQYDYPGGYKVKTDGNGLVNARIEQIESQIEQVHGASNAFGLSVGFNFTLTNHPDDELNINYLVTQANFYLFGEAYRSNNGDSDEIFDCKFQAINSRKPYRPAIRPAKQKIYGPQTAIVVGKKGEEIWTDKYGRVKVQFHWDRNGKRDEQSSCWVRVAQGWAGKRFGMLVVPRIGMEVIVDFLEGDPDKPIITGCVYNSNTMPPYALPEHQSRTTIKTESTKGGQGFNEIRFEDKKGAEEIYIQAEKDHNRVVKHNDDLKIGFEHKEPGSQTIAIKHDQKTEVGNDQILHVIKDQSIEIDGKHQMQIATTSKVEAKTSIEFKVGGSTILMEPGKITISAAQIAINASALASITGKPIKLN